MKAHLAHIQRLLRISDVHGDDELPGAGRHLQTKTGGGWQYTLASLMEALLAGRLLSNAGDLEECMRRSVHFLLGPEIAQQMQKDLQKKLIKVPSDSSLSRARLKLDACNAYITTYFGLDSPPDTVMFGRIFLFNIINMILTLIDLIVPPIFVTLVNVKDLLTMKHRQALLAACGHSRMFYMLSSDSSPQGKLDLMMTLEDRISKDDAASLIACGGEVLRIEEWASSTRIVTTQLPLGIIGSGNAGLPAKHECVFHQVTLLNSASV